MSQDHSLAAGLDPADLDGAAFKRAERKRVVKLWAIRALLVTLALAQIGDILSTNRALAASPGAMEANPVMHLLMTYLGSWWWLWKVALAGFLVTAAFSIRQPSRRQLVFAAAVAKVYILVLINNMLV